MSEKPPAPQYLVDTSTALQQAYHCVEGFDRVKFAYAIDNLI